MESPFPYRLRAGRLKAGLTQEGLADRLGITKQAVSKYEHGKMQADSGVLIQLSQVLELKPDYFFRPLRLSLDQVDFRKRASLTGRDLEGIKAGIIDQLERYLELEELLNLGGPFENPLAGRVIKNGDDVEAAVLFLLEQWNLGINPLPNVLGMLEDTSIKVAEMELDGRFDGLSAFLEGDIPVIVLNRSFDPIRKRFTALHELGHLMLHFGPGLSDKEKERLCSRFAGAMLLPKPAALSELGKRRAHVSLNELIPIKESYGISVQAIMYRAGDLGILPNAALQRFWKFINSNPDHRLEKGWGQFQGAERSGRFEKLLYQAVAEELISLSKGAYLANMGLDEFRDKLMMVV